MPGELVLGVQTPGGEWRVVWTTATIVGKLGIKRNTWTAYVARGQAPEPALLVGSVSLWFADEVAAWHRTRPGVSALVGA